MKWIICTALLMACLPGVVHAAEAAGSDVQGALPAGAQVVFSHSLHGYSRGQVVVYRFHGVHLGAILRGRLVWKRSLPQVPVSVATPARTGVFATSVTFPSGGGTLYAYRLASGRVVAAINGQSSGTVSGDEDVSKVGNEFLVVNRDGAHVGSVKYRVKIAYAPCSGGYCSAPSTREPDYRPEEYPRPNGVVTTIAGNVVLMRLEVAADQAAQERGLMNRNTLDADSGMVFTWANPVLASFWMENTNIALSIAFLSGDGTVQEIQDMQPQTTTLHTPRESYQYAIEMNQGFFAQNDIHVGDKVKLALNP